MIALGAFLSIEPVERYFPTPMLVVLLVPLFQYWMRRKYPLVGTPTRANEHFIITRLLWALPPVATLATCLGGLWLLDYLSLGPRVDALVLLVGGIYILGLLLSLLIARLLGKSVYRAYIDYLEFRAQFSREGIVFMVIAIAIFIVGLSAFVHFRAAY
jgi:hypothetical protein